MAVSQFEITSVIFDGHAMNITVIAGVSDAIPLPRLGPLAAGLNKFFFPVIGSKGR